MIKRPVFSNFAENVAIYAFFSGKIEKSWNLTGEKDLTNSKSGQEASYPKWGILEHFPQCRCNSISDWSIEKNSILS